MNKTYIAIGASVIGAGISFYAGYLVAESKLNKLYNEQMEAEIERTKKFYQATTKPGSPAEVAEALGVTFNQDDETAASVIRKVHASKVTIIRDGALVEGEAADFPQSLADDEFDEAAEEALLTKNIFQDAGENIDTSGRTADKPYQITTLEFQENEDGYDQVSITWYAGDNVLADESDGLIDNHKIIGDYNLERFGTGLDPNVVLVRNDRLGVDYEVTRSTGKYSHEVLGLQHGDETFERTRRTRRSADE